jgi:arylsulfatase A-like enzyme
VVKGEGSARLERFSPNAWTFQATLTTDATVLLNQNHHRLWHVTEGPGEVISRQGALAVRLPPGQHQVTVGYQPTAFYGWFGLSSVAWLGGLAFLWRRRKSLHCPLGVPRSYEATGVSVTAGEEPGPPPAVTEAESPVQPVSLTVTASLAQVSGASLGAAVLTAWGMGFVQAVDLWMGGFGPVGDLGAFFLRGIFVEGGLWAVPLGVALTLICSLCSERHALGRQLNAGLRFVLALDETERPGLALFSRLGGLLVACTVMAVGQAALSLWSHQAFHARELAAVLVGLLSLGCLLASSVVGVAAALLFWRLGAHRSLQALHNERWLCALPWLVAVAVAGERAVALGAPILKETNLRPVWLVLLASISCVSLSAFLVSRKGYRIPWPLLWGGGVLCGALGLGTLPGSAAGAVWLERGVLSGKAVRAGRVLGDRDGDGHSRILGGGDCDDGKSEVHPGAQDVPGNGVDEDCSGEDFRPPTRPPNAHRAELPTGLGPYRNVALVVVDTLRRDRLHLFGNPRPNTPFLDELATSSTVFEHAYANGVRSHRSIPSILTGRYPSRLWMAKNKSELMTLLPENVTLAERLTARGYDAAAFILEKYFEDQEGLTQGFDFHNPSRVDPNYRDWSKPQGEAVVNAAMRWIKERQGKPWLAWTHLYDPHLYWHSTPFGSDPLARYDAAVQYVDTQIARYVRFLQTLEDADRTLIVVTADHGQGLGTHGEWGHGQNLWQEDIRVPMLIHAPGFPAQHIKGLVSNVDLVPTILNLLDASLGLDPQLDGVTLVPLMARGDQAWPDGAPLLVVEGLTDAKQPHDRRAVLRAPYKLMLDLDVGSTQLFNLSLDPDEKQNRADALPDVVTRLRDEMALHSAMSAYAVSSRR